MEVGFVGAAGSVESVASSAARTSKGRRRTQPPRFARLLRHAGSHTGIHHDLVRILVFKPVVFWWFGDRSMGQEEAEAKEHFGGRSSRFLSLIRPLPQSQPQAL